MILHFYPQSPFSNKVRLLFGLKGLEWYSLQVPVISKNRITSKLTGGYRKIPVLQIGRDFYCDSSLIMREIQNRHPTPEKLDENLDPLAHVAGSWFDKVVFPAMTNQNFTTMDTHLGEGVTLLDFVEDRKQIRGALGYGLGGPMIPGKSAVTTADQLRSHLHLIENMFAIDSRKFILSKDKPTLLDVYAFAPIDFLETKWKYIENLPLTSKWLKSMREVGYGKPTEIKTDDAIKHIHDEKDNFEGKIDPDEQNPDLILGATVAIRPDDYGDFEIHGQLVASTKYSVCIERYDVDMKEKIRVHFPRGCFYVIPTTTPAPENQVAG